MEVRYTTGRNEYRRMTTDELRAAFMNTKLCEKGKVNLMYCEVERGIAGFAVPTAKPLSLPAGKELPLDAPVVFTLGDDSTVELKQQRAGDSVVYLYPTAQQVKQLAWKGVKKIEFGLVQADTFPDDALSAVIDKLYNSLMAVTAI